VEVRITHHARQRMIERKVSEDEVEVVLAQPEISRIDPSNSSVVYAKTLAGRRVSVATVFPGKATDPVVVKTVWV